SSAREYLLCTWCRASASRTRATCSRAGPSSCSWSGTTGPAADRAGGRCRPSSSSAFRGHLDSQRVRLVGGKLDPQFTAFFTSAPILASSAAVSFVSAKATGQTAPSSRFAASLNPNVAYLVLNFCAG